MADNKDSGGDGRGQVTDPDTDLRVDNKSGNMGKSFADNPKLAAAAGRKGGAHRSSSDTAPNEEELNQDIEKASNSSGQRNREDKPAQQRQITQKEAVFNAITEVLGDDE